MLIFAAPLQIRWRSNPALPAGPTFVIADPSWLALVVEGSSEQRREKRLRLSYVKKIKLCQKRYFNIFSICIYSGSNYVQKKVLQSKRCLHL